MPICLHTVVQQSPDHARFTITLIVNNTAAQLEVDVSPGRATLVHPVDAWGRPQQLRILPRLPAPAHGCPSTSDRRPKRLAAPKIDVKGAR